MKCQLKHITYNSPDKKCNTCGCCYNDGLTNKEKQIINFIENYNCDGAHHKQWIINEILKIILEKKYVKYRKVYEQDGEYTLEEGISP